METFEAFVKRMQEAFDDGVITTRDGSKPREIDYAIMFALSKMQDGALCEGKEIIVTIDQLIDGVRKYCGEDVYKRCLKGEGG